VLVILIDHPPPWGYAVFSEIGAHLDFDYRFAKHRFAEHEQEWAEVGAARIVDTDRHSSALILIGPHHLVQVSMEISGDQR
jgi:hypothetical protein